MGPHGDAWREEEDIQIWTWTWMEKSRSREIWSSQVHALEVLAQGRTPHICHERGRGRGIYILLDLAFSSFPRMKWMAVGVGVDWHPGAVT